jgi:hypothetical protein
LVAAVAVVMPLALMLAAEVAVRGDSVLLQASLLLLAQLTLFLWGLAVLVLYMPQMALAVVTHRLVPLLPLEAVVAVVITP